MSPVCRARVHGRGLTAAHGIALTRAQTVQNGGCSLDAWEQACCKKCDGQADASTCGSQYHKVGAGFWADHTLKADLKKTCATGTVAQTCPAMCDACPASVNPSPPPKTNPPALNCPPGQVNTAGATPTCKACRNLDCPAGQYRIGTCAGTLDAYACKACDNRECMTAEQKATPTDVFKPRYQQGTCSTTANNLVCTTCDKIDCGSVWHRSLRLVVELTSVHGGGPL